MEKGAANAMAIRASGTLIKPERESMANMGENLTRDNIKEMRKMKNEIVEPDLGPTQKQARLLPKLEESKVLTGVARGRYAEVGEPEELAFDGGILPDSQL